ncbi:MAG: ATP-binding protein [Nitrospirales bacterium]|nr:PAS domain-containing protein [Nitrospira sp.]MDR4501498.1 ATP-binding protein [Nitrospirales bacterium]
MGLAISFIHDSAMAGVPITTASQQMGMLVHSMDTSIVSIVALIGGTIFLVGGILIMSVMNGRLKRKSHELESKNQALRQARGQTKSVLTILKTLMATMEDKVNELIRELQASQEAAITMMEHAEKDRVLAKNAEKHLRVAHAENANILEAIPAILIGVDTKFQVTRWNRLAEDAFGVKSETATGRAFDETLLSLNWDILCPTMTQCLEEGRSRQIKDILFTRPSEKDGFLDLTVTSITNEQEVSEGLLIMGLDISERKELEAQLTLAQRMEMIGQLAAGIAHEINTPMQYIGDNLLFLKDQFALLSSQLSWAIAEIEAKAQTPHGESPEPQPPSPLSASDLKQIQEEIPEALADALQGTENVSRIVRAMKEFSHPGTAEKKTIDLNHAITNTVTVTRNEWKYVADVQTDLAPDLPKIPALPGEFHQVLLNLIVNAAHAIEEANGNQEGPKGRIIIQTRKHEDWVELRIQDSGTGIPEKIRDRIFDPFFTTKDVGKGTGQGLAIVHDVIVQKHKGRITVKTAVGSGTTFIIHLPLKTEDVTT